MWDNRHMEEQKSKSSKFTEWAVLHATWDLTGANLLERFKEECGKHLRGYLGSGVIAGGISYALHHIGVVGPWLIVAALVSFGLVLFVWDLIKAGETRKSVTGALVPRLADLPTSNTTDEMAGSPSLKMAPRIRVDCIDDGRAGGKGTLVFKSDKPAILKGVGSLVSRERYESRYEFSLIPSPPAPIDANSPIEYVMYGLRREGSPDIRSLVDIMRGGSDGLECVDSVVIDYDDDHGTELSRRFDLKRNQDDSIAWIPCPEVYPRGQAAIPDPPWQGLAELRHELYLASKFHEVNAAAVQFSRQLDEAKSAIRYLLSVRRNVELVGAFELLAQEADDLLSALKTTRKVLDRDIDRAEIEASDHPLKTIPSSKQDREKWTATHLSVYNFQSLYNHHLDHVTQREEAGFDSGIKAYPISETNNIGVEETGRILKSHAEALRSQAAKLLASFAVTVTIS